MFLTYHISEKSFRTLFTVPKAKFAKEQFPQKLFAEIWQTFRSVSFLLLHFLNYIQKHMTLNPKFLLMPSLPDIFSQFSNGHQFDMGIVFFHGQFDSIIYGIIEIVLVCEFPEIKDYISQSHSYLIKKRPNKQFSILIFSCQKMKQYIHTLKYLRNLL